MKSLIGLALLLGPLTVNGFGADGKDLFLSNKCDRCHAIAAEEIEATASSERMHGPDLGELGEERSVEWITQYVQKEVDKDGKNHRVKYSGSADDLESIAKWLVGLQKAPGNWDR